MSTFKQQQLYLDGLCLLREPRAECRRHSQDTAKFQGAKGERLCVCGYCVAAFDLWLHIAADQRDCQCQASQLRGSLSVSS